MIQDIAPHQWQTVYAPEAVAEEVSPVYFFAGDAMLVADEDGCTLPRRALFSESAICRYVFSLDATAHFLITSDEQAPAGFHFVSMKEFRATQRAAKETILAAWTAYQLANWYKDHRFCGRCGKETAHDETERALRCPNCGNTIYPRILPAVIVAVTNGDEIILTRYNRPGAYHALVAGFVEIGETLEDTVRREVMEEVGLKVKHLRYYKSQPWGIVDDLLCGFYCDVDGDPTITVDGRELKEAQWYRREDVDEQPDDLSLTNEMMQVFKAGKEPR